MNANLKLIKGVLNTATIACVFFAGYGVARFALSNTSETGGV